MYPKHSPLGYMLCAKKQVKTILKFMINIAGRMNQPERKLTATKLEHNIID
jgi:hypothetical protein